MCDEGNPEPLDDVQTRPFVQRRSTKHVGQFVLFHLLQKSAQAEIRLFTALYFLVFLFDR